MFKKEKTELINSTTLSNESSEIIGQFTSTVTRLQSVAKRAEDERIAKEQQIIDLQTETSSLAEVSNKATTMANKISELFI